MRQLFSALKAVDAMHMAKSFELTPLKTLGESSLLPLSFQSCTISVNKMFIRTPGEYKTCVERETSAFLHKYVKLIPNFSKIKKGTERISFIKIVRAFSKPKQEGN